MGEGATRQIGNIHSRKLASRPVFLHIPKGENADCMSPLSEMASMPASVLFLLSQQRITHAIHALAHDRGIMLDSVIERLAAPDSASIQIRTRLSARSHKSTTARNLIHPILDVQADLCWQKLKITIDPTGRMTAAYGRQRQSHTFTKANKTSTCRHIEILATMAVHDEWYLLHTNLPIDRANAAQVQGHYKNPLEVEEAFCELKSYLQVRPVFHRKPERVINHVRICFLAYWISARLARQWLLCGETGEVTRILRQLQTIRLGAIHLKNEGLQILQQITKVPADLNAQLAKLKLLHLFAAPPALAKNAEPTQP
jgi:hypothetical protein